MLKLGLFCEFCFLEQSSLIPFVSMFRCQLFALFSFYDHCYSSCTFFCIRLEPIWYIHWLWGLIFQLLFFPQKQHLLFFWVLTVFALMEYLLEWWGILFFLLDGLLFFIFYFILKFFLSLPIFLSLLYFSFPPLLLIFITFCTCCKHFLSNIFIVMLLYVILAIWK